MKIRIRNIAGIATTMLATLLYGCSEKVEEPIETERYRCEYIELSNTSTPETTISAEWMRIPHQTDTIGTYTETYTKDAGFIGYEIDYTVRGNSGILRAEITRMDKKYEHGGYELEYIFTEGEYFERPEYAGGGYFYEVRSDGIYVYDGTKVASLHNFRMKSSLRTREDYKGMEEIKTEMTGDTERAQERTILIGNEEREFEIRRESDGTLTIRETRPRQIDLGELERIE